MNRNFRNNKQYKLAIVTEGVIFQSLGDSVSLDIDVLYSCIIFVIHQFLTCNLMNVKYASLLLVL